MALDLTGVQRVVEGILDDQILITRDAGGRGDDVLDPNTGELHPQPPITLWTGAGAVVQLGQLALTTPVDGAVALLPPTTVYQAMLPLAAPALLPDDGLTVTGSTRPGGPRDPLIIGRRFRVADSSTGTFAVVRLVRLRVIS